MTDKQKELVQAVKKHALDHYEEGGWDFIVECYSDEDILDIIALAPDAAGAIERASRIVRRQDSHRRDIQAEIF